MLDEFAREFGLGIPKTSTPQFIDDWAFESNTGVHIRLYFIFISQNIQAQASGPSNKWNLGFGHRVVQMTLLNRFWELWKYDETKTIVNMVSLSKYPGLSGNDTGYSAMKAALYHQAFLLMFSDKERKCRMININPGYVRTEMTAHVDQSVNMLTPEECADVIAYAVNLPQHIEIGELSVWRPF